jgi:hypothetical protein
MTFQPVIKLVISMPGVPERRLKAGDLDYDPDILILASYYIYYNYASGRYPNYARPKK